MNFSCSYDDFYKWYNDPYEEELSKGFLLAITSAQRKDKQLWSIMDFDNNRESFFAGDKPILNGQVMEVSGQLCRQSLLELQLDLAGQHAPINDRNIHDVMCSADCSLNDQLRKNVMNVSKCDCLQLSLSSDDAQYTEEGSFCRENSGEYLCADLGKCGNWQCAISDFGCKRIEYNQIEVDLRGFGDVCSSASRFGDRLNSNFLLIAILIASILM